MCLNLFIFSLTQILCLWHIYKKAESGSLINKETLRDEIDLAAELDRVYDDNGDKNLYKELIVNNTIKIDGASSQME